MWQSMGSGMKITSGNPAVRGGGGGGVGDPQGGGDGPRISKSLRDLVTDKKLGRSGKKLEKGSKKGRRKYGV